MAHSSSKRSTYFKNLERVWDTVKTTYLSDFKDLVYAELPKEEDVFNTV